MLVRCFLAALSGALIFLSFPTAALTPLIFIALVPLLIAVSGASVLRALALGWIAGLVFQSGGFAWLLPTIARFEHTSTPGALPFFALLVAYQALQLALFGVGATAFTLHHSSLILRCALTACWWVVVEWAFPAIVPWWLGVPLADSPLLRQAADVAGVYGLSFVVALVNTSVATATVERAATWQTRLRPACVAIGQLAVMPTYGPENPCVR